jgi:hypothetical protein
MEQPTLMLGAYEAEFTLRQPVQIYTIETGFPTFTLTPIITPTFSPTFTRTPGYLVFIPNINAYCREGPDTSFISTDLAMKGQSFRMDG